LIDAARRQQIGKRVRIRRIRRSGRSPEAHGEHVVSDAYFLPAAQNDFVAAAERRAVHERRRRAAVIAQYEAAGAEGNRRLSARNVALRVRQYERIAVRAADAAAHLVELGRDRLGWRLVRECFDFDSHHEPEKGVRGYRAILDALAAAVKFSWCVAAVRSVTSARPPRRAVRRAGAERDAVRSGRCGTDCIFPFADKEMNVRNDDGGI
jgi:hypothetical protein